jgi:hypothetical protein
MILKIFHEVAHGDNDDITQEKSDCKALWVFIWRRDTLRNLLCRI